VTGLWITLIVLFLFDALRLRGRAQALFLVSQKEPEQVSSTGYRCFSAPGVTVPDSTRAHAVAMAHAEGLDVLDLIPSNLSVPRISGLLQLFDPGGYRTKRFQSGRTAGHAVVVSEEVLARVGEPPASDYVGFVRWAIDLKRCACASTELGVSLGLKAIEVPASQRLDELRAVFEGQSAAITGALVAQPIVTAVLLTALILQPMWGAFLLLAYVLQPLIILLGSPLQPPRLWFFAGLRPVLEAIAWVQMIAHQAESQDDTASFSAKERVYTEAIAGGIERFFEPRRRDCPLCGDASLGRVLAVPDYYQFKAGEFCLDECTGCGHIFQNPRLSLDGLNYYYGDFYDGLGEQGLESVFAYSAEPYYARARMLGAATTPDNWLDVGTGHGHFCCAARDILPATRFDGLDLSESIDEAVRRGWVDRGFRGLFPEMAEELAGRYDVVSMSHYLEHTRDPRAEIAAAARVLKPGGHLLIEVPDPACRTGRLMGRFWLPWFQPQHQHFVSVENLSKVFQEEGFTPVQWHRGEAHQPVDFLFAAMILAGMLSARPGLPWRPPSSVWKRVWHGLVWTALAPIVLLGWGADHLLTPFTRRVGWSNTYRVVARKERS
jgi:SAM-dependent methyltransferase